MTMGPYCYGLAPVGEWLVEASHYILDHLSEPIDITPFDVCVFPSIGLRTHVSEFCEQKGQVRFASELCLAEHGRETLVAS